MNKDCTYYSNILLANFENNFLEDNPFKPLFYNSFIVDVSLVGPHGEEALLTFIEAFNKFLGDIRFSYRTSPVA